jgi:hypothetical protein
MRRWSSAATCSIVSNETTASTLASASGSAVTDAVSKRRFAAFAYRPRAAATTCGSISMPTTL